MYEIWIYIIAILISIPTAILGSFLLLRKSIMVSDAISHSTLPGLVIGFLIAKSLYSPFLLVFASIFGVITIVLIEWIFKNNRIKKDASIGLSYTFLFAIGVLLISNFTSGNTELHQDCILYGDLNAVPINVFYFNDLNLGPKALWTLTILNIVVITTSLIGWNPFKISSFDPILAQLIGFKPKLWNYILMTLVSITIVIAFDIIGAVLIVSLLACPAASAYLISKKMNRFVLTSVIISIFYTLIGITISLNFNLILSATLALTHGVLFFVVFLLSRYKILEPRTKT
jgi:manganese/zinc/iron transport system permease protein